MQPKQTLAVVYQTLLTGKQIIDALAIADTPIDLISVPNSTLPSQLGVEGEYHFNKPCWHIDLERLIGLITDSTTLPMATVYSRCKLNFKSIDPPADAPRLYVVVQNIAGLDNDTAVTFDQLVDLCAELVIDVTLIEKQGEWDGLPAEFRKLGENQPAGDRYGHCIVDLRNNVVAVEESLYEAEQKRLNRGYWITHKYLIGEVAKWSVAQSPLFPPRNFERALSEVHLHSRPDFGEIDGMRFFKDGDDLKAYVSKLLKGNELVMDWNRSQYMFDHDLHDEPGSTRYSFTSRYSKSAEAENDFVDIDALARNVSLQLIIEASKNR